MFEDYEANPGWWFSAMLVLAKIRCKNTEEDYKEFCDSFIEYIETPSYLLRKTSRRLFIDD